MVLLQTILILLLVYYVVKLLLKWLGPKLFDYALKKTGQRFGQQFGDFQDMHKQSQYKKASNNIKKGKPKSNPSKKVGEYIDFEEIE